MPNPFFQFKKFTVYHDKCAMKVGTDGVLLGAWASVENARRILDIGTGTGLIALMLAQRSDASVVGVDIDEAAVEQARENIERSEWKNRIVVEHKDVLDLSGEKYGLFDVIVSNPPYFTEAVYCPDKQRNTARHMDSLPFDELLQAVDRLLAEEGCFSVILPSGVAPDFIANALHYRLYLCRQTFVHTKPEAVPKRVLMPFSRTASECKTEHLVVELARHEYSPEYIALTRDFYLSM